MLIRGDFLVYVLDPVILWQWSYCEFINRWSCGPSKFPWSFTATETMYLLEGKVIVQVDGHEGSFTIAAGDLAVFPKGMKVTWDVIEAVNKHYSLEK